MLKNKRLLIWKSKTPFDSYRVIWEDGHFVAFYEGYGGSKESDWIPTEPSYTAEQTIDWIESGNVEHDTLVV